MHFVDACVTDGTSAHDMAQLYASPCRFDGLRDTKYIRPVYSDATQLKSTSSCVAIDTLTDATQLSPTIGNATDPVEQRTANQREVGQSCFCSQCCIVMCDYSISLCVIYQPATFIS